MWKVYLLVSMIMVVASNNQNIVSARTRPVDKKVVFESLMKCCQQHCMLMGVKVDRNGKPSGVTFNGTIVNNTTRFVMKHGAGHRYNWQTVSIHWERNTTYAVAVRNGKVVIEPTKRVRQTNMFLQESSKRHPYFSLRSQVFPFGYLSSDMSGNVLLTQCKKSPFTWMEINSV